MFFSAMDEVPAKIFQHQLQYDSQKIEGIKNIIAISSGRDKVGKNTIAANIAVTLAQIGSKVGLLDADQNNLNVSKILGLKDPYISVSGGAKGESFEPVNNFGVKLVSIASIIDQDPLEDWCDDWCEYWLNKAIKQVLERVQWGDLDYLIVNLPPGIGDIQLALAQALPLYGVVMIATAQQAVHSDTYETLKMFEQLKVPIIGLIENMSNFMKPNISQRKYEIRGGEKSKSKIRVPFLGYVPLDPTIRQYSDKPALKDTAESYVLRTRCANGLASQTHNGMATLCGIPIVLAEPSSIFASALNTIVWAIASQITISDLKS